MFAIVFYILDGTIYQSPNLLELIRTKAWKSCTHLSKSYKKLQRVVGEMQNNTLIEWDDRKRCRSSVDADSPEDGNANDANSSDLSAPTHYIRECPDFHLIIDDINKYAFSLGFKIQG